jgi:AbrB family looped-hinge helix DNA binding protein
MKYEVVSPIQFATVSEKGWIVIPKDVRERFGIEKGDKVAIITVGDSIALVPVPSGDPIERARGLLGSGGPSQVEALLEDRRRELEREERGLPPPRRSLVADADEPYEPHEEGQ